MKQKLFIAWGSLHLVFIFLVNAAGAYGLYCEFYNKRPSIAPISMAARVLNAAPCNYYGRYTGAETGYGFFGMNVRSNGLLIGECGGKKLSPEFVSYESSLRFFALSASVTDDWIKPGAPKTGQHTYNDLVLRNIAVTLFQKNNCTDSTVALSYSLLNFPSLEQVKQGAPRNYELVKFIQLRYGIH